MQPEDTLTVEEVAEMCGVQPTTMRFWRHQNRGPVSVKVGRRLVYRRSDVEQWLSEQYQRTARGDGIDRPL